MPGPVSLTEISSRPSCARAVTVTRSPGLVWETALRTRLRAAAASGNSRCAERNGWSDATNVWVDALRCRESTVDAARHIGGGCGPCRLRFRQLDRVGDDGRWR